MTSSLVARLWMVAAGAAVLTVGLADAARGDAWCLLELSAATAILSGVAIVASGVGRTVAAGRR